MRDKYDGICGDSAPLYPASLYPVTLRPACITNLAVRAVLDPLQPTGVSVPGYTAKPVPINTDIGGSIPSEFPNGIELKAFQGRGSGFQSTNQTFHMAIIPKLP